MTMHNAIRLSPARIIALVAALAGFFAFGTVSFASADATDTIVNPFFKADTAGGLNGWQTSGSIPASYLNDQGIGCSSAADVRIRFVCVPESGSPVAIAGTAGNVPPPQGSLLGSTGNAGHTARIRSTDIFNADESDISGQSNFAMVMSGCDNGSPGTTTLSNAQPFPGRANDVLYGWSFFSSADWWPDSGSVQIVGPNGQATTVFQSEITSTPNPAGSWDHPVQPGPAPPNFPAGDQGRPGTGWIGWSYTFPANGNYQIVASSSNGNDCNGPSVIGLQMKPVHPIKIGQLIDFNTPSVTYGDPDFNVNGVAHDAHDSSIVNPTGAPTFSTTDNNCTVTPSGTVHILSVGDGRCDITASVPQSRTYASLSVTRPVIINPATLRVNANDNSKQYGAANPSNLTYGLSGFVNGENANSANVSGAPNCSVAADSGTAGGSYPNAITCMPGGLSAPNYTFQSGVQGTLTVSPQTLQIVPDDQQMAYHGTAPTLTSHLTGFINGDDAVSAQVQGAANCSIDPSAGPAVGAYPGAITCKLGTLSSSSYNFQQGSAKLTINPIPQQITFNGGSFPDHYTTNAVNPGATVSPSDLQVQYTATGDCSVGSDGRPRLQQPASWPGSCTITASQPGDGNHLAASPVTQSFSFGKPNVPPTVNITTAADGANYYQYQSIKANYSCQAAAGLSIVSCNGPVNQGSPIDTSTPGPHTFKVTGTDDSNQSAQATTTYNVIAVGTPQGNGLFTIGNTNASLNNNVNWWGSQWWKNNTLTGGTGPAEFKGYIDNSNGYPPQCGTTWTTRPGNSSKPPTSVPPYMAVVVSSDINKSGSTISGDVQSVVIVKTDAGYASDPGHAGTGTVVAKLCGNNLDQTITFNAPPNKTLTDPNFDPGATASSGLPVSYQSSTPNVCTVVSGQIDAVGVGTCTVTASQAGNDLYNAGQSVTRSFTVSAVAPLDCSSKKSNCESLLINPRPGANPTVGAGQAMTIGYSDDSPIGTGALAPTAQLSNGQLLPVTVSATSGLPLTYVTNYKRDNLAKNQANLSFSLPAGLSPGSYSVLVTVNDGDGDTDQWSWPVTVH